MHARPCFSHRNIHTLNTQIKKINGQTLDDPKNLIPHASCPGRVYRKMLMIWYLEYFFSHPVESGCLMGIGVSKFLQSMANIYLMLSWWTADSQTCKPSNQGAEVVTVLVCLLGVLASLPQVLFWAWQHSCFFYCCLVNFWSSAAGRLLLSARHTLHTVENIDVHFKWFYRNLCLEMSFELW